MDAELVSQEIGDFVVDTVKRANSTGCVIGLSGGVDSTTTAALIKKAFDSYNATHDDTLELVGYVLPSSTNIDADTEDGIKVAERLGIRCETQSIEGIVKAYEGTNPEALSNNFHRGNLTSRIRANVLSTKSATERKTVAGTGNKDEDFGIGYYTLFGDGAVHMSPISGLPKRLVRQMASYLGFEDMASRTPSAGLEPGQTDFKDLGYEYNFVELVTEGLAQGLTQEELYTHGQVHPLAKQQRAFYHDSFGEHKYHTTSEMVDDVIRRHENVAAPKMEIIHPPSAPVTLIYQ